MRDLLSEGRPCGREHSCSVAIAHYNPIGGHVRGAAGSAKLPAGAPDRSRRGRNGRDIGGRFRRVGRPTRPGATAARYEDRGLIDSSEFLFDGPADAGRTLVLAHGAGAPMDLAVHAAHRPGGRRSRASRPCGSSFRTWLSAAWMGAGGRPTRPRCWSSAGAKSSPPSARRGIW